MKAKFKNRKGSVSAFTVAIGVVLSILGMGMLSVAYSARIQAIHATKQLAAQVAADAGMTKAIYEMNQQIKNKPWSDETLPSETTAAIPNFDGVFSYTITKVDGNYVIRSTGDYMGTQKTIECILEIQSLYQYAIFSKGSIELKNSARIDWYNYNADDDNLIIATNSTNSGKIEIKNNAYINGDVFVGAGGDPDVVIDNKGTITGETGTVTETINMPSVVVPLYLENASSGGNITNTTTITTSGKYSKIDLKCHKKLIIDGNIELYITGKIKLHNHAILEITEGSSLIIYASDEVEGKKGSSFINNNNNPKSFQIMGLDSLDEIELKNSTDFFGIIYAPEAEVELKNSGNFYGAIMAKEFEQKNSSSFYYDASLRNANPDDLGASFKILRWSE